MKSSRILLCTLSILLLASASGCRSKSKAKPAAAPPAPAPAPVVERVQPETDFVAPAPQPEVRITDLAELTRRAHQNGWLRDAFYAYDAATLSAEAREALATSARWLRENPEYNLMVEGHTDERGTSQYNLALGDRRAESAREYLVTLGIPAARIRTVSYGEERPFATGSTESAWSQNRRAHLVLVD